MHSKNRIQACFGLVDPRAGDLILFDAREARKKLAFKMETQTVSIVAPSDATPDAEQPSSLPEVEKRFEILSDITDQVSQVNSLYETDLDAAFEGMERFTSDARTWDLATMHDDARKFYLSHMSFHREIVADIIAEGRRILLDERRPYLKRLVNYHRDFSRWLAGIEKKYAA